MELELETGKKIVLFDGVCNLCNNAITFIIRKEKKDTFRFAALQSDEGKKLAEERNIDTSKIDSIVLIEEDRYTVKSTAALRIARNLRGGYPLLYLFIVLPRFLRDKVYDFIAKNRYSWFGKKNQCMIPTPKLKEKFLQVKP